MGMEDNSTTELKKRKWLRWLVWSFWAIVMIGVLATIIKFYNLSNGDLPSFEDLENPEYDLATVVYDCKEIPFGKYYIENREQITYDQLSPRIEQALLSTEDSRFYEHPGIDVRALFRVAFKTLLLSDEDSGGGSTITQQLSKLLYRRPNLKGSKLGKFFKLVNVKLKEWITAVKLERSYTKEEILVMYLNKFEFINGAHGIQAAAQTYFGKTQDSLQDQEIAVLIGMLKNPSLYNPKRFPEKSKKRRNTVLTQMLKYDVLDQASYDTLIEKDLDMSGFNRSVHSEGPAPHFRAELTKWMRRIMDKEELRKSDGSAYNIYTDGLKVYTTIDLSYQKHAEQAVWEHMKWNQDRYWKVWKGRNPWTYEADSMQLIIRANVLERKMKESERYLNLHNKYLGQIKASLNSNYGEISLSENVIKALIKVDKGKKSLASTAKNKGWSDAESGTYNKILGSQDWTKLVQNFEALEREYKDVFKKKIPMMIFDYNELGEKEVEMSPRDSVRYHNQVLQAGMLAVHPSTGHIKAWVGGTDFKYFKYDHVNSRRQVGSTIKPFVYTTAIALQGISPCQEFEDIQYSIAPGDANFYVEEQWSPSNANEEFTGNMYNLYQGLLYSKNSITVRLIKEMGNVEVVRELLSNVGIDKNKKMPGGTSIVPSVPAICLGALDLTLHEMAGAYTTFANNGTFVEPIFISRIEDKYGKIIYSGIPKKRQAINPVYNHVILDMLRNNVGGSYGMKLKSEVGGKTGTTNDYADGWFMGVTPDLVVGTWVGGEDRWIRFLTLNDGQGFVMAKPIFEKFIRKIEGDPECDYNYEKKFDYPPPSFFDIIDCERYKQVRPEDEQNQLMEAKMREDEFDEEEFDEDFQEEEMEEEFEEGEEEIGEIEEEGGQ